MFQFVVRFFDLVGPRTHGKNHPWKFSTKRREKNTPWIYSAQLLTHLEDVFPEFPVENLPPFFWEVEVGLFFEPQNVLLWAWRFEYCVLIDICGTSQKRFGYSFDICHKRTT